MTYTYDTMTAFMGGIERYYEAQYGYVIKDLNKITRRTAKEMAAAVSNASPKQSGTYASGWTVKGKYTYTSDGKKANEVLEMIVHNDKRWQLTHLLEYDHLAGIDYHTVSGHAHIEPVEEQYNKLYIDRIAKAYAIY